MEAAAWGLFGTLVGAASSIRTAWLTEAMQKPDPVIAAAAIDLAGACRRMELAIWGSRADSFVRSSVRGAGKVGTALSQLVVHATNPNSADQPRADRTQDTASTAPHPR